MSWIMAIIYPIIGFLIIDEVRFIEYFTNTLISLAELFSRFTQLALADLLILACGWGWGHCCRNYDQGLKKKEENFQKKRTSLI